MTEQQLIDEAVGRLVRLLVEKHGLFLFKQDDGKYLTRNDFGMRINRRGLSISLLQSLMRLDEETR